MNRTLHITSKASAVRAQKSKKRVLLSTPYLDYVPPEAVIYMGGNVMNLSGSGTPVKSSSGATNAESAGTNSAAKGGRQSNNSGAAG